MFSENLDDIDDIELLKFHLTSQRRKLNSLTELLIKTEFDYQNVVSREQFERLLNEKNQLEKIFDHLTNEYQRLTNLSSDLIRKTKDLIDERDEYLNDWQRHRNNLTPRPDWQKVENVIDGGRERWKNLAQGKTSDELVEILLNEIDDENLVKNSRRMRRRITGILIKEIWNEKFKTSSRRSLSEEVTEYFQKRFDSKDVAKEIQENFLQACQRYRHNEQIDLFLGIFRGEIEEFVYHHQRKSIGKLLENFLRNIKIVDSFLLVSNDDFISLLKTFLPKKTSSQLNELFHSARRDSKSFDDRISLRSIFVEDDQGQYGAFLSTFIEQIRQEKDLYVEQIKEILIGFPLISVVQFSRAIQMIDPQIDQNELTRYIEWIFQLKTFDSSINVKPLDFEDLLKRLENAACFQH